MLTRIMRPHPLHVLKIVDGFLLVGIVDHLDESETAFAAGLTVQGQAAVLDLAVLTEEIEEMLLLRLERKIADVDGHGPWNR